MVRFFAFGFLSLLKVPNTYFVEAFNVVIENPIVLEANGESSETAFGYSLAFGQNGQAYVGAPNQDVHGTLHKCLFDGVTFSPQSPHKCLRLDRGRSSTPLHRDFFGANVIVTRHGRVYSCAPRQLPPDMRYYINMRSNTGRCYEYNPTTNRLEELFVFRNENTVPGVLNDWRELTVMGSAATLSSNEMLVFGAPLARSSDFTWGAERFVGTVVQYNNFERHLLAPSKKNAAWSQLTHSSAKDPHRLDLTGSSVVKGRFFYLGENHFAIGSPRADLFKGKVYLCPKCFNDNDDKNIINPSHNVDNNVILFEPSGLNLVGLQFGERFGETLCSVDINGDGYDDLLVGAPLYSAGNGFSDTGRVYVYKTIVIGHITTMELVTSSLKRGPLMSGSRFGTAIANLGFLDGDEYQDFAVGCPYEGSGVVYIYRGSSNYRMDETPQKISPESLSVTSPLEGFGTSFSFQPADIDQNNRPDFGVGAPKSGRVVIFRSRPTVAFQPTSYATYPFKAIDPNKNGFQIVIIGSFKEPVREIMVGSVKFMKVDERIKLEDFSDDSKIYVSAGKSSGEMVVHVVAVQRHFGINIANQLGLPRPIFFFIKLQWSLFENGTCSHTNRNMLNCPMLDPRSESIETIRFSVDLRSGCANLNVGCQCDLEFEDSDSNALHDKQNTVVVVGRDSVADFTMNVTNRGSEPAFSTVLQITSPMELSHPTNMNCINKTKNETDGGDLLNSHVLKDMFAMECKLPVMIQKKTRTLSLSIPVNPTTDVDHIPIEMSIKSPCSTDGPMSKKESIRLKYEYQIRALHQNSKSKSGTNDAYTYNSTDIPFENWFTLTNVGPSPTNKVFSFIILVPESDILRLEGILPSGICSMKPSIMSRFQISGLNQNTNYKQISCASSSCSVYSCTVKSGWQKGVTVDVILQMAFRSEYASRRAAGGEKDNFAVWIHLKKSDSNIYIHKVTEFFSVKTGHLVRVIASHWPVVLGVAIVSVICATILYALHKTSSYQRLRIYKTKLDQEEKHISDVSRN